MIQDPQGNEVRTLSDAVELKDARVLEIGCGDGRLTFRYASIPSLVVGIEPAATLLTAARGASPAGVRGHVHFVQATAPILPFRDNSFNVGSSRVDLQACKLEYSIVSPK